MNHWAIQPAFAVALILLLALAARRPAQRRFNPVRVGACAAYLGICSLRFPAVAAALPTGWAAAAIVWSAAVIAVCGYRPRNLPPILVDNPGGQPSTPAGTSI